MFKVNRPIEGDHLEKNIFKHLLSEHQYRTSSKSCLRVMVHNYPELPSVS